MSLDKKYNIPLETVNRMVNDGVISCSAVIYEAVYEAYKNYKLANPEKSKSQIFYTIANNMNMSDANVRKIVYLKGKKS